MIKYIYKLYKSYLKRKDFTRRLKQQRHDELIDLLHICLAGNYNHSIEKSRIKRFIDLEIPLIEMFEVVYAYEGSLCRMPNCYNRDHLQDVFDCIKRKCGITISEYMKYDEIMDLKAKCTYSVTKGILKHHQYYNISPYYSENYQGLVWYIKPEQYLKEMEERR